MLYHYSMKQEFSQSVLPCVLQVFLFFSIFFRIVDFLEFSRGWERFYTAWRRITCTHEWVITCQLRWIAYRLRRITCTRVANDDMHSRGEWWYTMLRIDDIPPNGELHTLARRVIVASAYKILPQHKPWVCNSRQLGCQFTSLKNSIHERSYVQFTPCPHSAAPFAYSI